MTTATTTPTVLPATKEWAHDDLEADYKSGANVWREVSEEFYWDMLEVLPPLYRPGGFMVSEPHSHDPRPVHLGLTKFGRRHFARLSAVEDFPAHVRALFLVLSRPHITREAIHSE